MWRILVHQFLLAEMSMSSIQNHHLSRDHLLSEYFLACGFLFAQLIK